MGKFDEEMDRCEAQLKEQDIAVDRDLLNAIGKAVGPALYNADGSLVAASQPKELETIKKNFLIKKLGLEDAPELDEGIQTAIDKIGRSRRNKKRAVFYYILTKHFKKESVFA